MIVEKTVSKDGTKRWKLMNGKLHREDGPAITWNDVDHKSWFLDGVQYTEKGYKKEMRVRKIKRIKEII